MKYIFSGIFTRVSHLTDILMCSHSQSREITFHPLLFISRRLDDRSCTFITCCTDAFVFTAVFSINKTRRDDKTRRDTRKKRERESVLVQMFFWSWCGSSRLQVWERKTESLDREASKEREKPVKYFVLWLQDRTKEENRTQHKNKEIPFILGLIHSVSFADNNESSFKSFQVQ